MTELVVGVDTDVFIEVALEPAHYQEASIYLLGLSGYGKSTLMANLAYQFWHMGEGVLVVDVKDGKLTEDIAGRVPADRLDDVVYLAPGDCFFDGQHHYFGLNVMEYDPTGLADQDRQLLARRVVNNVLDMFRHIARFDPNFMTKVRYYLIPALRLAIAQPGTTLITVDQVLNDQAFRQELLRRYRTTPQTIQRWAKLDNPKLYSPHQREVELASTVMRVAELVDPPLLSFMIGQPRSTIRLGEWLDQGKLVLANLGTNIDSPENVLLGNLLMAQVVNAAFHRRITQESRWWRLCVDEFDQLASDQFALLLNKARSFRVNLVVAHQQMEQLKNPLNPARSPLYAAATGIPITFRFHLSDEDRSYIQLTRGAEEAERLRALEKWTAELEVRGDANFPLTVELNNFWQETRDEQRLATLRAAQRRLVSPERVLAAYNREHYYADRRDQPAPESGGRRDRRPTGQKAEVSSQARSADARSAGDGAPVGADRTRAGDPPPARARPYRHQRPAPDDL